MLDVETGENLIDGCLEEESSCFRLSGLIVDPEEQILPAEPPKCWKE